MRQSSWFSSLRLAPPKGDKRHCYIFMIFAADADKLDADENTSAALVGFNPHFHTLAKAMLTGILGG